MDKIIWCKLTKNGLNLIASNKELSELYLLKAEEAIKTINEVSSKD